MAHEVFICYANQDKAVAEVICSKLEESGIRCWIAPRNVPSGQNFAEAIMGAVSQSRIMVLVFSASSNESAYCINEVHTAFNKRAKIIPFIIDDKIPSGDMEFYLQRIQWFYAQKPPLEQHLPRLVNEVKELLAQAAAREEAAVKDKARREAEEAAREKAKREAEEAAREKERREAEEVAKEKAKREAEETAREKTKREAEEAAREKARREAEEVANKKARREAEKVARAQAKQEAEAQARVRRESKEIAAPTEKPTPLLKKIAKSRWSWAGATVILVFVLLTIIVRPAGPGEPVNAEQNYKTGVALLSEGIGDRDLEVAHQPDHVRAQFGQFGREPRPQHPGAAGDQHPAISPKTRIDHAISNY